MRHHRYNKSFKFVADPIDFDKYTARGTLQYCLGASMYMPGTKDFTKKLLSEAMPGLTSIVMCFEDACPEDRVEDAEKNVLKMLDAVSSALASGKVTYDSIPLIFVRVRNPEQFERFSSQLSKAHLKALAGINFPKFTAENGERYFAHLRRLNDSLGDILYGMPIIEDSVVAFKETRMDALFRTREIVDRYRDIVLQIRVGTTDFSSCFGLRRGIDYSIYDIMPVRGCLEDIINVFGRNNDYVISGPVWEYFRASKQMMFSELPSHDIHGRLLQRLPIWDDAVDGLLREVILDKANGFVGRTVIHPTHVKFVNAMQAVTKEEYDDARQILGVSGSVAKSKAGNKMNEIKPHTNWAMKISMRAKAYGVIKDSSDYMALFSVND